MQISTTNGLFGPTSARNTNPSKSSAPSDGIFGTDASSAPSGSSVEQEFLKYAKMDPMTRMRASILKSMNLSEDDLAKMSPAQRSAVEQKIAQLIQQQLQKNSAKQGASV